MVIAGLAVAAAEVAACVVGRAIDLSDRPPGTTAVYVNLRVKHRV
jgi:hypothetical protein